MALAGRPTSRKSIGDCPSMEYVAGDEPLGSSTGIKPYQLRETPEVTTA